MQYQLNISRFEYRLLYYFHQVFGIEMATQKPSLIALWQIELPKLWHESELLRQCISCISSMYLGCLKNLSDISTQDYEQDINSGRANSILLAHCDALEQNQVLLNDGTNFFKTTDDYFSVCLSHTRNIIENVQKGNGPASEFEAAEIFFSTILIYSILVFHPLKLIPVISFDEGEPDLLSMCKGMKYSMVKAFPLLFTARYSAISEDTGALGYKSIEKKYPLIIYLRSFFIDLLYEGNLVAGSRETYQQTISLLEGVFYLVTVNRHKRLMSQWLFIVDDAFYDYLRVYKDYFALKLLYVFSCMCLFLKMKVTNKHSIWMDYVLWFRDYNMKTFGYWRDYEDSCFFQLLIQNFEFDIQNLEEFETFMPSKHVDDIPGMHNLNISANIELLSSVDEDFDITSFQ
ncbi:uncharacterized protein PRCAT00003533001 [Priceomyces carsonii]|uniref:uncharacterized protein n=1 Tax=Priceomyces carsonii TaxID=28549 RepID=UPI002EDB0D74|nr:unnamed protein product [Priceomyces carsonii]